LDAGQNRDTGAPGPPLVIECPGGNPSSPFEASGPVTGRGVKTRELVEYSEKQ
jgi:hypothetical protein